VKARILTVLLSFAVVAALAVPLVVAQKPAPKTGSKSNTPSVFADAPASARNQKNPYEGDKAAVTAGRRIYERNCLACHGRNAEGTGAVPSLRRSDTGSAPAGSVFWFVTKGDQNSGMPAWGPVLSAKQRWQVVSYVKSLTNRPAAAAENAPVATAPTEEADLTKTIQAPLPPAPFLDFRVEAPGKTHKITVADLPAPYASQSASNGPKLVKRPENAWPKAPQGFKVDLFASGLDNPRELRTAPNGDIFVAESSPGNIKVFRGIGSDGKPQQTSTFATGLERPFGIAFYPPGPNPQWVYVGNTNAVVRFAYRNGDLKATGQPEQIAELPRGRGHWTRDVQFSADGKKMFVSVGSASNVDDPDTHPGETDRADVLEFNPDGSGKRVYAYGIRNCVGLTLQPQTNQLWCSVNERDALGDNLVPDYITHIEEGGFYGWPWWYMGGHQDPRHEGKHPELKDKVITPDVLLQPHSASLQNTFYEADQFPAEYKGDLFGAEHGSWNRGIRVGYEVVRVPMHGTGKASGEYQDFMTGFVLPSGDVWGRPVGITVAPDGSLLVSDDGSNSIWRVSYKK
jgi:glucose/arabinose dehydrogenase/mono/diheme cytochrome c family protein